jgi:hypothetical protein
MNLIIKILLALWFITLAWIISIFYTEELKLLINKWRKRK